MNGKLERVDFVTLDKITSQFNLGLWVTTIIAEIIDRPLSN